MIISIIIFILPWPSVSSITPRCIHFRRCDVPPEIPPGIDQYNFNRYNIEGTTCVRKGGSNTPTDITLNDETRERALTQPIKCGGSGYLSRWRVEYKIGNDERNLVYIDINSLHIRGKTCMDMDRSKKCTDFVKIIRENYGPTEVCDQADVEEFNDGDKMHSLDSDTYTAIFQTGEYEHKFIKGYKGPLIYSLPFQEAMPSGRKKRLISPERSMTSVCIEKSDFMIGDFFPDYPEYYLNKDLANFHQQWKRMSLRRLPGTEEIIVYILYNQTVTYRHNTITVFENDNITAKYDHVKVLKTFNYAGDIEYHVGRVKGNQNFTGPGPLVIVCNCAFFQLFVIDPRGLLPNKAEKQEIRIMYTPMLANLTSYVCDEAHYNCSNITAYRANVLKPAVVVEEFSEEEKEAVSTAHINSDPCNPVVKAQSDATLRYYNGLNRTLVESLTRFAIECSLTHAYREDGHCVTELGCTFQPDILRNRTTCQVNNELPDPCDPFLGPVQFLEKIDYMIVTSVNTAGRRARITLLHSNQ